MNAVEIEEAISKLAEEPFDAGNFPFAFLEAFGNKETTIKRLKSGNSNQSDLPDGVLQRNNIHLKVCAEGEVTATLAALRQSPKTTSQKAKFILATDGKTFEAENLADGETVACAYSDFHDHFGFFLPLAGITTVRQIRENAFDIKATGRLNRLYIELLRENQDWDTDARRQDLNHFMARLIFCFFAEDTDIFNGKGLFTATIDQMSARDSSNTHEVIAELFNAMNIPVRHEGQMDHRYREAAGIKNWANAFPYVNGGLFTGSLDVPRFSRPARSYLLHVGSLDWTKINPDIFGSMIQAVADDEERGALGMHYTSVPNILKVLNPLFLDDLRARLTEAGDNARKLLNLRQRIARIRVFDPACGSGNFLVIAYKEMRKIEAKINILRGEAERPSDISIKNFRGIELRHFSAEIARLALIIAKYQRDVVHRGQQLALAEFLPLEAANWITCGNALWLDWLSIWPPTGKAVKNRAEDLFETPLDQAEIDFENEGGETYICGNPQFKGARKQSGTQKQDMAHVFGGGNEYKDCDYVTAWYVKASEYSDHCPTDFAFVSTNSISRGEQVEHLWSRLYAKKESIFFCHTQFQWANNAAHNAGVWCVIIGSTRNRSRKRLIYTEDVVREVTSISPYLIPGEEGFIKQSGVPLSKDLPLLFSGSMARDDGNLIFNEEAKRELVDAYPESAALLRPLIGTSELKQGTRRWCLWIADDQLPLAQSISPVRARIERVTSFRAASKAKTTRGYAKMPHKFAQRAHQERRSIVIPKNTPDGMTFITPIFVTENTVTTDLAFVSYTEELWVLAFVSSTLQRVWAEAISGGLGSGVRYSSHITYNASPLPTLTEQNKADLTRCAENILLAREAHFPGTIADLYDPETMPANLRAAHERNDETMERIYLGRRFKNDTERLEKLFELYTQMTAR
ncbi:MAG: class I SAM-dependent DNA methyltransferase [Blastocatellia bacterium]|nr:class I SAM-dependent DNA methyltransferase [Blastocatellia bacterium]